MSGRKEGEPGCGVGLPVGGSQSAGSGSGDDEFRQHMMDRDVLSELGVLLEDAREELLDPRRELGGQQIYYAAVAISASLVCLLWSWKQFVVRS